MKKVLFGLLLSMIVITFCQCNNPKISRPNPTEVGYRELVEETDDYSVYQDCKYRLVSVSYDTIAKRQLSTIETPAVVKKNPIADRVDLNDVFDPKGEGDTDWNYTEITESDWQYLKSIGVYWDSTYGCYRKHK